MADPIGDSTGRNDVQGGRRPRHGARRPYRVEFSLTGEEFELLEAAAGRAGRARGAYAAEVGSGRRARRACGRGHVVAGAPAGADPRVRARPQDRREPQPGGGEAERDRAAFR